MTKKTLIIYLISFISFFVQSNYSIDQETSIARINGISIAYVTAGEEDNPPVLMIMGLNSNLKRWPTELIEGLVNQGFYVITYDNRDTGKSTWVTKESTIIKLIKFGVKKMKAIYLLALFAVSSHAHEGNAIFHYHVSDYLIIAVVTVVTFGVIRILKRRDV